jgi:flagellar biosynthesis/type III secretory pathway M-ring protein FliF/YscJ
METRLIIAYALLALLAVWVAVALWRHVFRDYRRRRRTLADEARWEVSRAAARASKAPTRSTNP